DGRRVKLPCRLRRLVPAIAVEDRLARRLGHAFPEVWVRGQRGGSLDEDICIVNRGQERVLAVADELGGNADGRGHAADPAAHRLDQGHWPTLDPGGDPVHVEASIDVSQVVAFQDKWQMEAHASLLDLTGDD